MLLIYFFLCVFLPLDNILPNDVKMVTTRGVVVVVVVLIITFVAVSWSAVNRFTFLKEEEEEDHCACARQPRCPGHWFCEARLVLGWSSIIFFHSVRTDGVICMVGEILRWMRRFCCKRSGYLSNFAISKLPARPLSKLYYWGNLNDENQRSNDLKPIYSNRLLIVWI